MSFSDELKKAKESKAETQDVPVLLNGDLYTIRLSQMNPADWVSLTDQNPKRAGVAIDSNLGYDLRGVTRAAVNTCAKLLKGDAEVEVRSDDEVNEWEDLLDTISGQELSNVNDAVFGLNAYMPGMALEAAVEAAMESQKKAPARSSKASA